MKDTLKMLRFSNGAISKTLGHREGEFPVCEDVAARSIALPFFPNLTQSEAERVAEALCEVAQSSRGSRSTARATG